MHFKPLKASFWLQVVVYSICTSQPIFADPTCAGGMRTAAKIPSLERPSGYVGNRIDRSKLLEWVHKQPGAAKNAAAFVAEHLQLVTLDQLEHELVRNFSTFLESLSPEAEVVIVNLDATGTSKPWVTEYLTKRFSNRKLKIVNKESLKSLVSEMLESGTDLDRIQWTLLDDATYTGTQMALNAAHITNSVLSVAASLDVSVAKDKIHIAAVVPYYQTEALESFRANRIANVKLHSLNHMPTVEEVDKLRVAQGFFNGGLTLFQHKISDLYGVDVRIQDGYIHGTNPRQYFPFLQREEPPYRVTK